jgi:release factor glutamine methyltransferase
MNLHSLYKILKTALTESGIEQPEHEARWMVCRAAGIDSAQLITSPDSVMSDEAAAQAMAWLQRRVKNEPLGRIFGETDFHGLAFTVTPDVLDPRGDTEVLVDIALKGARPHRILDLGTGSGCIIITLLYVCPDATGVAVDVSDAALLIARANADRHGVGDRLSLRQGSWFDPIKSEEKFDLIVSNPPYIATDVIKMLGAEVQDFDPILALDGGIDGFDSYKIVFSHLRHHLTDDGRALFEIGYDQADGIARLAEKHGFRLHAIHPDPGGLPRVAEISCGDK